jgi:creatinine amidohydrolase/Fe(II)-dependent formamide hydrolase-like protein
MMQYRPHLVDLSRLSPDRSVKALGVGGEDPRDASAEHGRECMEQSVELVRRMFVKAGLLPG